MEKIVNEILREEVYYEKLDNGLDIYFMPKKGFTKKFAVLATNYGSNELEFIPINGTEKIRVNEGIAHFLEHKMFEQPGGGNAFDKFSKLGANANAYTNFTMTAYLFSCTDNFYENLEHLIDYVQTPYFTKEDVNNDYEFFIKFELLKSNSCSKNDTYIIINGNMNKLTCKSWKYHNQNYTFDYLIYVLYHQQHFCINLVVVLIQLHCYLDATPIDDYYFHILICQNLINTINLCFVAIDFYFHRYR